MFSIEKHLEKWGFSIILLWKSKTLVNLIHKKILFEAIKQDSGILYKKIYKYIPNIEIEVRLCLPYTKVGVHKQTKVIGP